MFQVFPAALPKDYSIRQNQYIWIMLMTGLLAWSCTQVQGTLYITNLARNPITAADIGSDSWFAQAFNTGNDQAGYMLDAIQLRMNPASGTPDGFTVSLYSALGLMVGSHIGDLGGPDPASGGIISYSTSDMYLTPLTGYFVVVSGGTPVAEASYRWSAADG